MKTLYLPINSQNFNSVFASESISPYSFYKKRGFGITRFKNLFPEINDYLVLFNQPPEISLESSDEVAYVLTFQLSIYESFLKQISEGIWIYPKTIYLSLKNFKKLYFLSDHEKRFVVDGAESSKTTKTIKKYENIFGILDKKSQKKYYFSFNNIEIEENKIIQIEIERDRIFNSFKGFLYGILCGYMRNKSENEIEYSKSLKQIINDFALLKNKIANSDKTSIKKQTIRLEESVCQSELLFKKAFNYVGTDLISRFFKAHIQTLWQWVQLLETSDSKSLFENNVLKSLKKNSDMPIFAEFQIIKQSIDRYISNEKNSYRDGLDSDIKNALFNLEKYGENEFSEKTVARLPDLNNFDFEIATKKIKLKACDLNKEDKNSCEVILSVLINHAKNQKGRVYDEFFVDVVKDIAKIAYPNAKKTPKLLKYLQHDEHEFDIHNDVLGTAYQNLAAFIFNPNSLEELQEYLEDKKIDNHWIAYSFWGVFNGFASMSKNFTVNILGSRDHSLINKIDERLSGLIETEKDQIQSQFDEKNSALRQMPDMPLSELQSSRSQKTKERGDIKNLSDTLPKLDKENAISELDKLKKKELIQHCKQLKISVTSKKTKPEIINKIVEHFFELNEIKPSDPQKSVIREFAKILPA